jgi:PAS domain S-box-containing protein
MARSAASRSAPSARPLAVPRARAAQDAELLRLAENTGNMGHWYTDLITGLVTWSPHVFRIFGVDPAAFTPSLHAILAVCHPDDRAQIEQTIKDAIAGHMAFEFDCRIVRPDGSWRTIITSGQSQLDDAGCAVALFGVVTDVTDAFDTLRSIQDQNEMLHLAAQLAHLGHWVWSRDEDRVSFCSEELACIHEMSAGTFVRQFTHPSLLAAVIAPEHRDHYRTAVCAALTAAQPYEVEYRIKTRSGAFKDIREIGQPIFGPDEKLARFIATAQDVTEAKRRENELREAHRRYAEQAEVLRRSEEELKRKTTELQLLNLQKDKLFSIIAHDLRSPFNSIIGFADLLVTNARDLSHGQTVSYAQIVRESATGVHNLLDNLLAWASFQIRDGALKLAPFDIAAVAAASLEPLAYMAETKSVTVANSIPPLKVMGDEPLIRIVLRNLVSNGIKFSRNDGMVRLTAARLPAQGAVPDMIRVSVRDDGVGIPRAVLANLFELDRTVSAPGTRGERGTGLGLYLCRDIIVRHGGAVTVDSEPGSGTSFHFTMPAAS